MYKQTGTFSCLHTCIHVLLCFNAGTIPCCHVPVAVWEARQGQGVCGQDAEDGTGLSGGEETERT